MMRIIGGAVASPLAIALVRSLPAVGSSAYVPMLLFSAAVAFLLFMVCAGISHLILRWKRWTRLRQYLGVMFAVATAILALAQIAAMLWIFREGGSDFHSGTQVIENGRFTIGGLLLTLIEAMVGAIFLSASFALFWVVAVRPRSQNGKI
jgi:xanthine/uracil permease